MTVGQLERTMSMPEFRDWQRFENQNLYPLPDRLIDVHFATLISTLINVMTTSTDRPQQPVDYLRLREGLAAEPQGLTDIDEIGRQLDAMQGG